MQNHVRTAVNHLEEGKVRITMILRKKSLSTRRKFTYVDDAELWVVKGLQRHLMAVRDMDPNAASEAEKVNTQLVCTLAFGAHVVRTLPPQKYMHMYT